MNQVYRLIAISLGLLAAFLIFLGIVFFIAFAQSPQHPFAPFNTSTSVELHDRRSGIYSHQHGVDSRVGLWGEDVPFSVELR